jgi:YrbI family 3-deoxy-D-manno-octulosonate 8-phosphate phosphatase
VVLDLDGVLTDGRIAIDARGGEARTFHDRDRTAIALLARVGIRVVVLANRTAKRLPSWASKLGVWAVVPIAGDPVAAVRRFGARRRFGMDAVAYVGHDVLALPLLASVGLAVCVADGASHAKRAAHWITAGAGGSGVTFEVAERVLRAQGKWASTLGAIWRRWN